MHHVNIPFRIQFPQVICWLVVASFSSCCPWRKLGGDGVHPLEGDPRSETAIEIMGNMWGKWWLTINMLAFFPTCSDKPGFVTSLGHNLKKSCPGLCNNDGKMGVPPPPKKKNKKAISWETNMFCTLRFWCFPNIFRCCWRRTILGSRLGTSREISELQRL